LELPIELGGVEGAIARLDAIPVRGEADQIKRIRQQLLERRAPLKAERLDLPRTKADPNPALAASRHRKLSPGVAPRLLRPREPEVEDQISSSLRAEGRARTRNPRPARS